MDNFSQPLNFRRYVIAARDRWWIIALAGLAGGLLQISTGGTSTSASAEVIFRENPTLTLAAQVLDATLSIPRRTTAEYAERFRTKAFRDEFRIREGATLTVTQLATGEGLAIEVTSPKAKNSKRALDIVVSALRADRAKETSTVANGALAISGQRKNALNRQVANLTKELKETTAAGLSEALARERADNRLEIARIEGIESLLKDLLKSDGSATAVTKIADPTIKRARSRTPDVVLFGIVGALLALVTIALASVFDRRVRTRADIDISVGSGATLSVVGREDKTAWGLALAIDKALGPEGRAVLFIGVPRHQTRDKDGTDVETVGKRVVDAFAALRPQKPVSISWSVYADSGLTDAASADVRIVVASYGRTNQDDLHAVVGSMHAAGAPAIGVALVDVPPSEIRYASR
jgi:hypothetical protein